MLKIGCDNVLKFDVEVHGTKVEPTVRVILVSDHEMGFLAQRDGDRWAVNLSLPDTMEPGEYDLRVEVTLNNKLFVPVKRRVQVTTAEPTVVQVSDIKLETATTPPAPTQTPDQPETPKPLPPEKPVTPVTPVKEEKKIEKRKKLAERPKSLLSDVAAESGKKFDKILRESQTYKKPVEKSTPTVKINTSTIPITLTKGEIVFE